MGDGRNACMVKEVHLMQNREFTCAIHDFLSCFEVANSRRLTGMLKHAKRHCLWVALLWLMGMTVSHAQEKPADDPTQVPLSPVVNRLLNDPINTLQQKLALALFHGQWESLDAAKLSLEQQAELALAKYDLASPVLRDANAPAILRAEAANHRGQPEEALALLDKPQTLREVLAKADALETLGQLDDAAKLLEPWRRKVQEHLPENAADLTRAGLLLSHLANLEGLPARDYQQAMNWFAKARNEMDRLYWPAYLAEAQLLVEKGSRMQAIDAIMEALSLNPNSSELWLLLGQMSVDSFQFEKAADCIKKLRAINPTHLLADELEVRSLLAQRDLSGVEPILEATRKRYPANRTMLALKAAYDAMQFDHAQLDQTLAQFDKLSPGNPMAVATAGEYLSVARQYEWSEQLLRKAITMQPNWPKPRSELALMLMQAGRDDQAFSELEKAAALDPFHKQVQNQLELAQEMKGFKTLKTKHYSVTYPAGPDEALALDMQTMLDQIYVNVTTSFSHEPAHITQIQIMPNERWFGVRITGIPEIWTIAACTGDVIAMTPPKTGARQRGAYDWARVIQHEFTHTVTLDLTHNRLAHWFTEACAVAMEPGGRDYNTCQLLADALQNETLFDLKSINWAFVRPKSPTDRPLAYAQANWMYDYITATFGHDAILAILDQFAKTNDSAVVIQTVTNQNEATFMQGFKQWAHEQVQSWGLGKHDGDEALAPLFKAFAQGIQPPEGVLATLIKEHPDHPDVLRLIAEQAVQAGDPAKARAAVLRYAQARPVDPWPNVQMVKLAQELDHKDELIGALTALDSNEQTTGQWAFQLARLYSKEKQWPEALASSLRAIQREPYNADYRENAATMALLAQDMQQALHQVRALTMLEPDRSIHWARLAALSKRMGDNATSQQAAQQAIKLDPNSPAKKLLQ
jgi:tetratricopeptide (TPR) repeat protein